MEALINRAGRSAGRVIHRLVLWTAALPLACVFCAPSPDANPPDVLLVTVDTLRPDYMSMNGYDRPTTPAIDELLGEGFYFEQAVSPVARTAEANHPAVLRFAARVIDWAARSEDGVAPRLLSKEDEAALRQLGYLE